MNCKESAQYSVPKIPGSETKDTSFMNLRQLHHQAAASGASRTPACGNHSTCMSSLTIQADLEGLLCNSSLLCGQPPRPPSHSFPLLARSSQHFIYHNPHIITPNASPGYSPMSLFHQALQTQPLGCSHSSASRSHLCRQNKTLWQRRTLKPCLQDRGSIFTDHLSTTVL